MAYQYNKIFYKVPSVDKRMFRLDVSYSDVELVVDDAAIDFWHNHDGRECEWPLEFEFFDPNGNRVAAMVVDYYMTPSFECVEVKSESD